MGVGHYVTSYDLSNMFDAARRTRVAARGWATRAGRKLSVLITADSVTFIELNYEVEQFDKRLNTLDAGRSQPSNGDWTSRNRH